MSKQVYASHIAADLNQSLTGDFEISGVSSFNFIHTNTLLFYNKNSAPDLTQEQLNILRTCLILAKSKSYFPQNIPVLTTKNPRLTYAQILHRHFKAESPRAIDKTAKIHKDVKIGKNVSIGAFSEIQKDVIIESNVIIDSHVTIKSGSVIGFGTRIKTGAVIGDEGFGFDFDENNTPVRIPHMGKVILGKNVEVGIHCVISKGTIDDTIIEDSVKINDLSKIAHNVFIGKNTIITGARINGSVRIEADCWISPGVVIQNKVQIGKGSQIGTGSVVVNNIKPQTVAYGNPATEIRKNIS